MGNALIRLARNAAKRLGVEIVASPRLAEIDHLAQVGRKALNLAMLKDEELKPALELLDQSQSQLNQDFFVLHELGWKRNGYFVEFGATDGVTFSNTYLLESVFGWNGILAEPARSWREQLSNSGRTARLEFDCVWSASNETLQFSEADWAELSTLSDFKASDGHRRTAVRRYPVTTVSLNDLLDRHDSPSQIDYLSIDTEGSEHAILEAFDFSRREIKCITCEHNFTPNRERIRALLSRHGYRRKFADLSQFDDWYVLDAS